MKYHLQIVIFYHLFVVKDASSGKCSIFVLCLACILLQMVTGRKGTALLNLYFVDFYMKNVKTSFRMVSACSVMALLYLHGLYCFSHAVSVHVCASYIAHILSLLLQFLKITGAHRPLCVWLPLLSPSCVTLKPPKKLLQRNITQYNDPFSN